MNAILPLTFALAVALAGCAAMPHEPPQASAPPLVEGAVLTVPASPARFNYRQLTADEAAKQMKTVPLAGAQISELAPPRATQLGDAAACLKTSSGLFAVFYEDAKVIDMRRAVVVDGCEQAAYGPLPPPRRVTVDDDGEPLPRKPASATAVQ